MDWNGDGTVSRDEIIESFYAVAVNDSQDGNRHCRTFVWRSTGEQIAWTAAPSSSRPRPRKK